MRPNEFFQAGLQPGGNGWRVSRADVGCEPPQREVYLEHGSEGQVVDRRSASFSWNDRAGDRDALTERMDKRARAEAAESVGVRRLKDKGCNRCCGGVGFGREIFREWQMEQADELHWQ